MYHKGRDVLLLSAQVRHPELNVGIRDNSDEQTTSEGNSLLAGLICNRPLSRRNDACTLFDKVVSQIQLTYTQT
jgi:hypothetical protein